MNLSNFERMINPDTLQEARRKYDQAFSYYKPHVYEDGAYVYLDMDRDFFHVEVDFDEEGEIIETHCNKRNCRGELCVHVVILLLWLKNHVDVNYFNLNDRITKSLIHTFSNESALTAVSASDEEYPTLVPELFMSEHEGLKYRLKFGRQKKYIVKNIFEFSNRFATHELYEYGKGLSVVHDPAKLDEKSYQLMKLSVAVASTIGEDFAGNGRKDLPLNGVYQDSFFEMYKDETVVFEGREFKVNYADPKVRLIIEKLENGNFSIRMKSDAEFLTVGRRGCFIDRPHQCFLMADPSLSHVVRQLKNVLYYRPLEVRKENITAFATSVLKKAGKYMEIEGLELLGDYQPPQLEASLYLDEEDGSIMGRLVGKYGEKEFEMPYKQSKNPCCDYESEAVIQRVMEKYMVYMDRRWWCEKDSDEKLYALLSEGLPRLNSILDVYLSDRVANIRIRPPVRPAVGVRPDTGKMLELEITCEGYSNEELITMLQAYRKGRKYVRMKDGTFASLDESIQALNELTENLNITDRALLKEKIHIPQYRMLYLDSLSKDTEALRLDRSKDFQKAVAAFHAEVEEKSSTEVPESLERIMRDYQKHGYAWMKTIAGYGFGGILADDMGLGKTIQALALVLDYKQHGGDLPSLVVCPSSLVLNWENEVLKFAPSLKTLLLQGSLSLRAENLKKMKEVDLVITSYSTLVRDIAEYENESFHFEFIDEAQYIKNQQTQMAKAVKGIHAKVRFALTGTPVENSLAELWSIFDFIMPGYLFNYSHFKNHFETPIVSRREEAQVKALQKNVSPFILRRMKQEVLSELPDKTVSVLRSSMDEEQSRLYSANIAQMKKMLMTDFEDQGDRFKVLAMITRLRQICCDPHLAYENYEGGSAKLEQCMELVQDCVHGGHKILLFSQFTSMLDIVASRFEQQGISYYMLTGKTGAKKRIEMVDQFNTDDTQVFLISLKAGGTGLNLTGADIVIHFDPWWNVSAENQASDRAYRIGQKRNVQIYKLVADGTIEDKILMLQESKSELFDIAVNGEGDIMHMKAEDILNLLQ